MLWWVFPMRMGCRDLFEADAFRGDTDARPVIEIVKTHQHGRNGGL